VRVYLLRLCEKSNQAQEIASFTYRIRLNVQLCNHKNRQFSETKPSFHTVSIHVRAIFLGYNNN